MFSQNRNNIIVNHYNIFVTDNYNTNNSNTDLYSVIVLQLQMRNNVIAVCKLKMYLHGQTLLAIVTIDEWQCKECAAPDLCRQ